MVAAHRAVVAVLGEAVADDEQHLQRVARVVEFAHGVADGRPHAGAALGLHGGDGGQGAGVEGLAQVLGDVELHAVAPVSGEAVDAVAVAQAFKGRGEDCGRLLLHVDDAPLRRRRRFTDAGPEGAVVLVGVAQVGCRVRRMAGGAGGCCGRGRILLHGVVGGGGEVHQQRGAHIAVHLLPAAVEPFAGRVAGG